MANRVNFCMTSPEGKIYNVDSEITFTFSIKDGEVAKTSDEVECIENFRDIEVPRSFHR